MGFLEASTFAFSLRIFIFSFAIGFPSLSARFLLALVVWTKKPDFNPTTHTPQGLAALRGKSFLTSVHRPRFKFIDPGLLVPTPATVASSQVFTAMKNNDKDRIPILRVLLVRKPSQTYTLSEDERSFHKSYKFVTGMPSGLYSTNANIVDMNILEDSFSFVLPYRIGQHGFARRSDGRISRMQRSFISQGTNPWVGSESAEAG